MSSPQPKHNLRLQNRPQTHKTNSTKPNPKPSEFVITAAQKSRIKAYQRIVAGILFLAVPSVELYRRLYLDRERKIQQGELNPREGTIREFDDAEKRQVFQNSWLTRIFGEK